MSDIIDQFKDSIRTWLNEEVPKAVANTVANSTISNAKVTVTVK